MWKFEKFLSSISSPQYQKLGYLGGLQHSSRWNSIIEVMVAILIVTIGVMWAYEIVFRGQTLATTTENRVRAINIAREGLEIVENIRDTNWIKLSSDTLSCYDVLDYNVTCIGAWTGSVAGLDRMDSGSYITLRNANGTWTLKKVASPVSVPNTSDANYLTARNAYLAQFPVYQDSNGLVTQTWSYVDRCVPSKMINCNTGYSREIIITRPTDYSTINAEVVVTWVETARKEPLVIRIPYTLYNWKYEFYKD